jgi:Fur family ferric uptake transcriptional regulator
MARKTNEIVLGALRAGGGFATAQEVHQRAATLGATISIATVYRALGALAEAGVVDQLVGDDALTRYRFCGDRHHHHLVCRRCGTTVEIEADGLEGWARETAAAFGYREVQHILELSGLCGACPS